MPFPNLPFLAKFPNAIGNSDNVMFPVPPPPPPGVAADGGTFEVAGGLTPRTYTGKLAIAPGVTDPILWTRGSYFNLGYAGSLADKGAIQGLVGSGEFWDSPKAWGNEGFLPRLPNTVLLLVPFDQSIEDGINQNLTYFNAKNINLLFAYNADFTGQQSVLWQGIPLDNVTFTLASTGGVNTFLGGSLSLVIPSAVPTISPFLAGSVFVASIADVTPPGYSGGFSGATTQFASPCGNVSGFTFASTASNPTGESQYIYFNTNRAAADLASIASIIGQRYIGFVNNAYYDLAGGPYQATWVDDTPVAAYNTALMKLYDSKYYNLKTFNSTSGTIWDAIFADIQAFFGM
jgi:hypothetical protein